MLLKTCSQCHEMKELEEFSMKNKLKDIRQCYCKTCWNATNKIRYQNNKQYYIDKADKRQEELIAWFSEFKKTLSCGVCGFKHVAALQFHHDDPSKKERTIAEAVTRGWSKIRLLKEIEKCRVLCANCHFVLHYEDRHS